MDIEISTLEQYSTEFINWVLVYGGKALMAIILLIVGRWVARGVTNFASRQMKARGVESTIASFIHNMAYAALMAFVIIAAMAQIGIQTASFIAVIGAAGLAVGLALQGSLSNFAAGVLLIIFKPFKAGDFIEAGGASGIVEEISIFTTLMRSVDNKSIVIPNASILGGNIVNYSAKPTRRIDLVVGVSYEANLAHVKLVLKDIVSSDERILTDVETVIGVDTLADSSVNLVVRPWVNSADYWAVYFDLNERIKTRFDGEGIGIPYPQMDLHMVSMPSNLKSSAAEKALIS